MKLKDNNLLRTCSYINGEWLSDEQSFDVLDPATGELICSVAEANTKQLEYAIVSAKVAQVKWARKTVKQRATLLMSWFSMIMENQSDLAQLMTLEQGKPLKESIGEIA